MAAKELRFVMSISRPGPPGWGAPGFLPQGSAEQAREIVYGMKSDFIARCRASGRENERHSPPSGFAAITVVSRLIPSTVSVRVAVFVATHGLSPLLVTPTR